MSFWTWMREVAVFVLAAARPAPMPEDAARGHGQPVIVVPAFFSMDSSTTVLRRFLARQGFAAECWGCGMNLGPRRQALLSLDRRLRELSARHGRKVSLVGISLGGTLAREAAKRRADCVERVVTLVSPINLPVATPLAPLARAVAAFWDDLDDGFAQVAEPPPMPVTAIVSPIDGVVDWRACLPAQAPQVETVLIAGAHMTIGSNPEALRVVAERLAAGERASA